MNFLAHLYLSHGKADLMIGNLAADMVKGNDWESYASGVQQGILLHRAIDAFTDSHTEIKSMITAIRPVAGRYSGPVVDILCDHLLAKSWAQYHTEPLELWSKEVYGVLLPRIHELPEAMQPSITSMIAHNWLLGYDQRDELEYVMNRFNRRLRVPVDIGLLSKTFFEEEFDVFEGCFQRFFPEIVAMTKTW
jgi:acyl carrier protein phosphodiesterase